MFVLSVVMETIVSKVCLTLATCIDHVTMCVDHVTMCVDHVTMCVDHVTMCVDHVTMCVDHVTMSYVTMCGSCDHVWIM